MRQNARLSWSVALAIGIPVLALTGCPGLIGGTSPTPTPTTAPSTAPSTAATTTPAPTPTPKFTSGQDYTGRLVFGGNSPAATQSIELRFPTNSSSGVRVATVSTTVDGYFQIKDLSAASYQFLFDPATATASSATTNFTDLYVTDAIAKPKVGADNNTAGFTMDAGWALGPEPAVSAATASTGTVTFKWTKVAAQTGVAAGPLEFQVVVRNVADTTKSWSSAWADRAQVTWGFKQGTETDSPTGTAIPTGATHWQVKWRTKDTTDGSKAFGQSHWIPLTIN